MPKNDKRKTPHERSAKSHVPPPPREQGPHGAQGPNADHGTGEFTGRGQPPLQKK
jgi:hypothetical protein